MASMMRTRPPGVAFDIHEDHMHHALEYRHQENHRPIDAFSSVLGHIPLGTVSNYSKPTVDPVFTELNTFYIDPSTKENLYEQQPPQPTRFRGRKARPHVESSTFSSPLGTSPILDTPDVSLASHEADPPQRHTQGSPLEFAVRELSSNAEQLLKHQAGQFEWLLTVPAPAHGNSDSAMGTRSQGDVPHGADGSSYAGEKRVLFGCNLVLRKAPLGEAVDNNQSKPADIYTIVATRIEGDECFSSTKATTVDDMSILTFDQGSSGVARMPSPPAPGVASLQRAVGSPLGSGKDDIVDQVIALPPANPRSRIEDSVEALDKLEEELEAINEVARLDRVLSPEKSKNGAVRQQVNTSAKRAGPASKKPATATVRVRTPMERTPTIRKSVAPAAAEDDEKPTPATRGSRKSLAARPASLQPPKPPVKSSKPPTVSTFELPGEAVARRLKEQREARLSRQVDAEQASQTMAAYSPSKPHAKSTKAPTRPTFELPGEAISRRKREEREAKLRAQEEEERKRREFKARPIRTGVIPSSFQPKETIASRARQGRAAVKSECDSTPAATSTPSTSKKRQSMTPGSSLTTPRMARGRSELVVSSSAATMSRATSTSTGSIQDGGARAGSVISISKRSTVSSEDQAQQKARGRQIFSRDNSIAAEREKERREREAAAKQARQEAAERSRQLSREWAEKRAKRASLMVSASEA